MDLVRIRENAQKASSEYLLDRVTIYRGEMENAAVAVFETELNARGIGRAEVDAHTASREKAGVLRHPDGTVVRCHYCSRPAAEQQWRWHRLWGWFLPLFPKCFHLCHEHVRALPRDVHGRILHHEGEHQE
jgi:hypothetical protein